MNHVDRPPSQSAEPQSVAGLSIERLALTCFRNHGSFVAEMPPGPVILLGPNGAGKTNILEAVSLLSAGQGLRNADYADLAQAGGDGSWAVAARLRGYSHPLDIGTGIQPRPSYDDIARAATRAPTARLVRVNGQTHRGTGILSDLVEVVWVVPAMDGLFTGAAGERRRFLDRLILCFDPAYRTIAGRFERAMRSRNRLLADGVRDNRQLAGLEAIMASSGVAVAAGRAEAASAMESVIERRRASDPTSPFPWSTIAIEGTLEADLKERSALDVEESYAALLGNRRERDRAAGRTLDGPHRSDLIVGHGDKNIAARLCSTGEQKALLIGLVLAHAELVAARGSGRVPILLLDEITAHLDVARREALFTEIRRLGAQAWMTGTDATSFAALEGHGHFIHVGRG